MGKPGYTVDMADNLRDKTEIGDFISFDLVTMSDGAILRKPVSGIVTEKYPKIFKLEGHIRAYSWNEYLIGKVI